MINFKLKEYDKIVPVGQEPDQYLSWFWLTDGDLWLTLGNDTIYEYTPEAINYFAGKPTPYNDYYIVRFLEDFTGLFEKLSEPVPDKFYHLTTNIKQFRSDAKKWLDKYDTDENEHSDFYFEEYHQLISWAYQRLFDSAHLVCGPYLSFFRNKDRIRIVWDSDFTLENGISTWTAKDGHFEMDYADFVHEVKLFGENFFKAMDKQVELTVAKDWGNIRVDKEGLIKEHKERKLEFDRQFAFLEQGNEQTDWNEIDRLYMRMINEMK